MPHAIEAWQPPSYGEAVKVSKQKPSRQINLGILSTQMMWRTATIMILLFWITQFGVLTVMRYTLVPQEGFDRFVPRAIVAAGGLLISLAMLLLLNKGRRLLIPKRVVLAIGLAAVACILYNTFANFVYSMLIDTWKMMGSEYILSLIEWFWFYIAISAMILVLDYGADLFESRIEVEALKTQATLAHLSALRYQLNPHFLFNALNSIAALIVDSEPERAEEMVVRLSDFLRASLDTNPMEEIPLTDEMDQQRRYLEIEQIRFPSRLAFEFDVSAEVEGALVPSLILQPLVENAVKYGVAPSARLVTIAIKAEAIGDAVQIVVSDNGNALNKGLSGSNIGHYNVRERLASLYGGAASIVAQPSKRGGYVVTLCLPMRRS